ncbi:MAG TPA: FAD-dependent oxidoreductase [Acidimicrobiales bacterium]|nr:FAD-dependent oxidoreductase [Acidimicrobiales bacterium]
MGAGVSGTYCAWRLQQALGGDAKLRLFEGSSRIGGRLHTVALPGQPQLKAEFGGMRYIPDRQSLVASLVTQLDLPTDDLPAPAPPNRFFLRGQRLGYGELGDLNQVSYDLPGRFRGLGPAGIQTRILSDIAPEMADMSLDALMDVEVFGVPLWKHRFWDLLLQILGVDGRQFMMDAAGYDGQVTDASAVTHLPATDFPATTRFVTLRDGFDQLPKTLAQRFEDHVTGGIPRGHRVRLDHRLVAVLSDGGAGPYTLVFDATNPAATVSPDATKTVHREVRTRKVVLALPRRSLQLITGAFFHDPWVERSIPAVLSQGSSRLFLAYERPWWHDLGLDGGHSVTDLPIRKVFYLGPDARGDEEPAAIGSLLMASFNASSAGGFWKGLESGERHTGYRPAGLAKQPGDAMSGGEHAATKEMVRQANRQVAAVHGLRELPMPYRAAYHTWDRDPFGGGWHAWRAGYRPGEVAARMRRPVPGQDIYIVGEAYSLRQGWVEGALETTESTLQEFFDLGTPAWLAPGSRRHACGTTSAG